MSVRVCVCRGGVHRLYVNAAISLHIESALKRQVNPLVVMVAFS